MPKNNQMKYSIVIRSYNEEKYLEQLLRALERQETKEEYEVIIVDSGSTDRTCEIAAKNNLQIVHIAKEDFSFGYALNRGIEAARGEFILLISAHCYPTGANWIQKMSLPFSDPKVALVYGKQEGNHISKFSEKQLLKKWFPSTSFSRQRNPFCNNANAAIRKSIWEEIPYNEELTGLEDIDWAQKVIDKGYYLYYNTDAQIVHVHEETFGQILNRYRREAITLKQVYKDARFTFKDFISLTIMNIVSDLLVAAKNKVFFSNAIEIILFRTCQFWGTYQGYRLYRNISPELRERFYYPLSRK